MSAWLDALRVRQWHKNLLVFVALVFSFRLADASLALRAVFLFVAFCAASSATYLFNDLFDLQADRLHPLKSRRAIASGAIARALVMPVALMLILFSELFSALFVNFAAAKMICVYFALQLAYNLFLRAVVVADVIAIAMGFIIRAVAGAVAIGVPFSEWLVICTFFGAVRLAIGKRQAEVHAGRTGLRKGWEDVSEGEMNVIGALTSAVLLVSYTLYSFVSRTAGIVSAPANQGGMSASVVGAFPPLLLSLPIVYFGVIRYELLAAKGAAAEPELLPVRDRPIAIALLAWLAVSFSALYLWRSF